jgi:hypothetical protein
MSMFTNLIAALVYKGSGVEHDEKFQDALQKVSTNAKEINRLNASIEAGLRSKVPGSEEFRPGGFTVGEMIRISNDPKLKQQLLTFWAKRKARETSRA